MSGIGGYLKQTISSTASTSAIFLMLALSITVALAWFSFVKYMIDTYVTIPGSAGWYHFLFAIVVTVIAVILHGAMMRYFPY